MPCLLKSAFEDIELCRDGQSEPEMMWGRCMKLGALTVRLGRSGRPHNEIVDLLIIHEYRRSDKN